jgi:hypothetical protein
LSRDSVGFTCPFASLCSPLFSASLILTPESATVAELMQLVQSRLKPGHLAHVRVESSELLDDESFEDYWAAGALFVLTAGNAPRDAQHVQGLVAAKAGIAPPQPQPALQALPPHASPPKNPRPVRSAEAGRHGRGRRDQEACSLYASGTSHCGNLTMHGGQWPFWASSFGWRLSTRRELFIEI